MSWGAGDGTAHQFWRSRGSASRGAPGASSRAGASTVTGARAPPPPAWWFQNGGRGGTRLPVTRALSGGVAPAPARPEPLKPDDECEASCILEKRVNGDAAQYFVEWKQEGKENSWVNRNDMIDDWSGMRGAMNQFELLLLEEIKEVLKKTIEQSKTRVHFKDLTEKVRAEYPYFNFLHIPRDERAGTLDLVILSNYGQWDRYAMQAKCPDFIYVRSIGLLVGKIKEPLWDCRAGSVATPKQQEGEKTIEKEKGKKLKEAYSELIEVIRFFGGKTEISYISSKFSGRCGSWFKAPDYGFEKFKPFVMSCPGVYVHACDHNGQQEVELKDENPEELEGVLEDVRRRREKLLKNMPMHMDNRGTAANPLGDRDWLASLGFGGMKKEGVKAASYNYGRKESASGPGANCETERGLRRRSPIRSAFTDEHRRSSAQTRGGRGGRSRSRGRKRRGRSRSRKRKKRKRSASSSQDSSQESGKKKRSKSPDRRKSPSSEREKSSSSS